MTFLFSEHMLFFIYLVFCIGFSLLLLFASLVFSQMAFYQEKLSPYECGFDPFDDARESFDIRFYIVAILFLVFDLETSFLFPWAYSLNFISFFGFWVIIDFFLELIVGFIYVWKINIFSLDLCFLVFKI